MRSRAALLIASVAFGACSVEGVSIEIRRGSTSAERVELYIMDGVCTTDPNGEFPCSQLKTPSARTYLEGQVYTRDDARTLSAEMKSGVAYFTIRANEHETRIPLVVAVGFEGNTRVGAVMIEREFFTTDNNRQIATLDPIVEDRVTGEARSEGLRVETWYHEPNGCVALEKIKGDSTQRTFVVPASDPDCDGFEADTECDSMWPDHGPDDDNTLPFTCLVVEQAAPLGRKRCLLGDAPCVDGQGAPECAAVTVPETMSKWCVPSSICAPICANSTHPGCLYTSLKNPTGPPNNHPTYVECVLPVQTTMTGFQFCRGAVETAVLTTVGIPGTTSCTGFSVGPVTQEGIGPFTTLQTSTTPQINSIRTDLGSQCSPSIRFTGDLPSTTSALDAYPDLVLKLDTQNGISVIVPLVVSLEMMDESTCQNAQATCTIVSSDVTGVDESLASCLNLNTP